VRGSHRIGECESKSWKEQPAEGLGVVFGI
jgi:hypothetical protein